MAPARIFEIRGGHVPTAKTAKRIEAASDGEVPAASLLGLDIDDTVATSSKPASARRLRSVGGAA